MGMAAPVYWTADLVRALPADGNRYEVAYGELLVTPAPRPWHEVLVARLIERLGAFLRKEPVGIVLGSRADISWGEDVLVQPDVFVVDIAQARTLDWARFRNLLLVAEVLSPSTARTDRFVKRRRYQEAGIPLYWVIDGDTRQVEVWTPHEAFPTIERSQLAWQPTGAATSCILSLEELFRPI
jgi:Uma2 family endonuclease